jgi:hypothetical protein
MAGDLDLEDGAAVTTSGPLTNSGLITLDEAVGGSLLNVEGTLTNTGTISIGAFFHGLSAESTVEAAKVVNDGTIDLYGGKAVHATLHTNGAFTNDGSVDLTYDTNTIGGAVSGTGISASRPRRWTSSTAFRAARP